MDRKIIEKVQVWVVSRKKTSVLLLKTGAERGGFWQPVTGSLEPGESLQDAALREAREETGLSFSTLPVSLGFFFEYEGRWGRARKSVFYLEIEDEGQVTLDPTEHVESEWLKLKSQVEEIQARLVHDEVKKALTLLALVFH